MEDVATHYTPEAHLISINADFRIFNDLTDHLAQHHPDVPGGKATINKQVKREVESTLIETVITFQSLRACANRLATFCTWQLQCGLNSLFAADESSSIASRTRFATSSGFVTSARTLNPLPPASWILSTTYLASSGWFL
jgi:hypothetical protein